MQLNRSESARVTTASEARFRVDYPNSRPRVSRIIALDRESHAALLALKGQPWNGARFLRYVEFEAGQPVAAETPRRRGAGGCRRDQGLAWRGGGCAPTSS